MDPLSAFGLAANILAFIDFSYKIFSASAEISSHGTTEDNRDLQTIIDDVQEFNASLGLQVFGTSKHDVALKSLATRCQEIAKELEENLGKLRVKEGASRIKAVTAAIRSVYKKQGILDRIKSLDQYRSQILLRLVAMLGERQVTVQMQIDNIQSGMDRGNSQMAEHLERIKQQVEATQRATSQPEPSPLSDQHYESSVVQRLEALLDQVLRQSAPPTPETRVLKQLYFNSIYFREDQVTEASDDTFTWLLDEQDSERQLKQVENIGTNAGEEPEEWERRVQRDWERHLDSAREARSEARTSLLKWLSSENGLFHVSGRAGSGKSTLMKMIFHHPQTRRELELWAGDGELLFAQFFFYRAGTREARSLEGLYRSILFETLLQQPRLIPEVFPEAYSAFERSAAINTIDEVLFRTPLLRSAMGKLMASSLSGRYYLCFMIDGLDEFGEEQATPDDYLQLAEMLISWAKAPNVKILVSSRPLVEFTSAFLDYRRIHLHQLNELDILQLGLEKFQSHKCFHKVQDHYKFLLKSLSERSNGIFLWASLVLGQLLHKLSLGESITALVKQLDNTPRAINELYLQILKSTETGDFNKGLRILWLVISYETIWSHALPLLAITWVDQMFEDPEFPISCPIKEFSLQEAQERQDHAELQINYYTKGLLETRGSLPSSSTVPSPLDFKEVVFLHRTVYDFVRESEELHKYVSKYANLTMFTTKLRLELAEMWFHDIKYLGRRLRLSCKSILWNDGVHADDEQAHFWLDSYERIITYDIQKGMKTHPGFVIILGRSWFDLKDSGMSWLHWIVYRFSHEEFVIQEISKRSNIFPEDEGLSLLLSTIFGTKKPLVVRYLLQNGASPNQQVSERYFKSHISASAWHFLCIEIANEIILTTIRDEHDIEPELFLILEEFLRTKLVDTNVLVLVTVWDASEWQKGEAPIEDDATHAITLLDLIQQYVPHKADHWATLFGGATQGSRSWIQNTWSAFTGGVQKAPSHPAPGQYLPFSLGMDLPEPHKRSEYDKFVLQSVVVGKTMVPAVGLRLRVF